MANVARSGQRVVSEAEFGQAVIEYAMLRGWMVCHFRPARTDRGWRTAVQGHVGFPDLALARDGVVILAELKAENGRLTDMQAQWASAIGTTLYRVWKPSQMQEVIKELT